MNHFHSHTGVNAEENDDFKKPKKTKFPFHNIINPEEETEAKRIETDRLWVRLC